MKQHLTGYALGIALATGLILSTPAYLLHAQQSTTTTTTNPRSVVRPTAIPPYCPPFQPNCKL